MPTISESMALAIQHHQQGRLQAAEQIYRQVLQVDPNHAQALHLLGVIASQVGHQEISIDYITRAIRLNGREATFHYNLGLAWAALGKLDQAIASYQNAIQLQPGYVDAHNTLGNALKGLEKLDDAIGSYRRALVLKPDYAEAHNNLGVVLMDQGKHGEAVASLRRALNLKPDYLEAHNNLGIALKGQGRVDEATACYRRALDLNPDYAEAHNNLGLALADQGKNGEAVASYRRALGLKPHYIEAHNNLGAVLIDQGKYAEAIACLRTALELQPNHAGAYMNLGLALAGQGNYGEAVDSYRRALDLKPDYPEADMNLGNVLKDQGKHTEAITCYRTALELEPNYVGASMNLGLALADQGKLDQAVACFRRALDLKPGYAEAHMNLAHTLLQMGDFVQGWKEYEWRFVYADIPKPPADLQPIWDGKPLQGQPILLWTEQGLGDSIQFIRFAPLVQAQGGRVIVYCPVGLAKILATCPGVDQVVVHGEPLPDFACHISLMSLPRVLGITLQTVPAAITYLSPDPELVQNWAAELGPKEGLRIGIAWQGNPKLRNDRNRSFPITHFESIANIPGVRLFSLQKGAGAEQLQEAGRNLPITDLGSRLHDFSDTAAVLKNLDLLICPDTALAHLAGALEVPVWVALPFAGEWRWLLNRDDSPWYSKTMRLYRQQAWGDWEDVFRQIAIDAQLWAGGASQQSEAISSVKRPHSGVISAMPTISESMTLAIQHHQQGRLQVAEQIYRQVLQVDPDHANALHLLGVIASQVGRQEISIDYITRAIRLNGKEATYHYNLGLAWAALGKLDQAIKSYQNAIQLQPGYVEAYHSLGNALKGLEKLDEAISFYRQALELRLDYADAYNNLGVVLLDQGKHVEAVTAFRRALDLKPDYLDARYNLGNALKDQGKLEEAVACYGRAVELRPDYTEAHWNRSLLLLQMGNFVEGWNEYEWRFKCLDIPKPPTYPQPIWDGNPLQGRPILLWTEQGLGDAIHFIRFAPQVQARGGRVIVHCPSVLAKILASAPGVNQVVAHGESLPEFDCHISLMSLPRVLGTTLETIPASIPYLATDPELVQKWTAELGPKEGLRIGISWQGYPGHKNDRNRSFPITHFQSMAKIPGVRLFSLQKGAGIEQLHQAGRDLPITDLGSRLYDFSDTAAVLKNLDMVICPDTAIAHLAGALEIPVWVALPFVSDWRWLLNRDDSPWYPNTMRLYRQQAWGDWEAVFARIVGDVQERVGTSNQ